MKIPVNISLSKFTQDVYLPALKAIFNKETIPARQKKFLEDLFKNVLALAMQLDAAFKKNKGVIQETNDLVWWNAYLNFFCGALSEQYGHELRVDKKLNHKTNKYVLVSRRGISIPFSAFRRRYFKTWCCTNIAARWRLGAQFWRRTIFLIFSFTALPR